MTLALALLAAALAAAQPGPGGGPPPELRRLADEVRGQPTDAKSVHPRFKMIMDGVRMRGMPPPPPVGLRLKRIQALLADGALTEAAGELDAFVLDLEAGKVLPPPPEEPPPPPAPPEPREEAAEPLDLKPVLLSQPMPKPAIAQVEPPAKAAAPAAPLPDLAPVVREPLVPPPPKPAFPWALTLGGLGVGLLGLAALLNALRRQDASPVKPGKAVEPTLRQKYQVGELLASGGMGEVYEGRDLTLGRRVAIKKMLADAKLDSGMRAVFAKEARTVAKLAHPYIVQIHECLEEGEDLYLVFEFVDGEPLSARLTREGRLPLRECKRILSYVCQAVDHAHKNHVLHRDLKPGNIMLDKSGIARVMDFGIALESTRTQASAGDGFLDASGTLRYMPPEQHNGTSVRASDVYALGVCLYEMATGQMPFAGGTVEELLEAKRARKFIPPTSLVPALPRELDLFMTAVLDPDPKNRISSAAEFLEALQALPS